MATCVIIKARDCRVPSPSTKHGQMLGQSEDIPEASPPARFIKIQHIYREVRRILYHILNLHLHASHRSLSQTRFGQPVRQDTEGRYVAHTPGAVNDAAATVSTYGLNV
jgi:hypothetical protein